MKSGASASQTYNYAGFDRSQTAAKSEQFRNTVRVGQEAPDFEITRLDGSRMRLADYRGKYVLLEFGSIT